MRPKQRCVFAMQRRHLARIMWPQTRPFLRALPSHASRALPCGFWLPRQGRVPPKKLLKQLQHSCPALAEGQGCISRCNQNQRERENERETGRLQPSRASTSPDRAVSYYGNCFVHFFTSTRWFQSQQRIGSHASMK